MYRRKLTAEERKAVDAEIAADKHCVDVIRGIFGMAPLYGDDRKQNELQGERFGARVYHQTRVRGGRMCYELEP